jgi:hypothetical protein
MMMLMLRCAKIGGVLNELDHLVEELVTILLIHEVFEIRESILETINEQRGINGFLLAIKDEGVNNVEDLLKEGTRRDEGHLGLELLEVDHELWNS